MLTDAKPAQGSDAFGLAREKIRVGPAPGWVVASRPDLGFVPKESKSPSPTTLLLWSVQANIESNETCVHLAIRLETMQAVQHESQWRLELEPQSQTVLIHWIKIHRLNTEIDHTNLDKVHFLQREAGLEGCVIDGCFTALLLLEDVRPGDVLEWCYTMKTRPTLLPENRHAMYHLPAANFGKLLCIVRFDEDRPLKWKSFSEDFKPEEIRENGQTQWRWSRENFCSPEPEVNVPAWHLASPWIQVSDCPDWGIVARSVTSMWESVSSGESTTIVALIEDICSREQDRLARVERVLRLIQDEFRYLSVNLDHGCQIPSPPDTVARRRFGDCKDLCVLLVKMFQQLGVSAKPVLVNTAKIGRAHV